MSGILAGVSVSKSADHKIIKIILIGIVKIVCRGSCKWENAENINWTVKYLHTNRYAIIIQLQLWNMFHLHTYGWLHLRERARQMRINCPKNNNNCSPIEWNIYRKKLLHFDKIWKSLKADNSKNAILRIAALKIHVQHNMSMLWMSNGTRGNKWLNKPTEI